MIHQFCCTWHGFFPNDKDLLYSERQNIIMLFTTKINEYKKSNSLEVLWF